MEGENLSSRSSILALGDEVTGYNQRREQLGDSYVLLGRHVFDYRYHSRSFGFLRRRWHSYQHRLDTLRRRLDSIYRVLRHGQASANVNNAAKPMRKEICCS